jgi:8-oxo-dGTP diphosphatase
MPAAADRGALGAVDECRRWSLDHAEIVAVARRRLAAKLAYSTIALQLMPERFTLSELQAVHEIILGEPLDKRNFRKRVLATGLHRSDRRDGAARRPSPGPIVSAKRPGQVDFIK